MAERIPSLQLTDPSSRNRAPSFPLTPILSNDPWEDDAKSPLTRPLGPARRSPALKTGNLPVSLPHSSTVTPTEYSALTATTSVTVTSATPTSPIDPLSQQILQRTRTISRKDDADGHSSVSSLDGASEQNGNNEDRLSVNERTSIASPRQEPPKKPPKEKRKGVSFLSRIIGSTKKKSTTDDVSDSESQASDTRPEAVDAQVYSQAANIHTPSLSNNILPTYIKIRTKHQKKKEFDRTFLAQELHTNNHNNLDPKPHLARRSTGTFSISNGHEKPQRKRSAGTAPEAGQDTIWAFEWSADGRYLATGGHDSIVRVWSVISSADDRLSIFDDDHTDSGSVHSASRLDNRLLNAHVFRTEPYRTYHGHESAVLDLSWSKNGFLLSSSMDKTVRLWHVSRPQCLCTFNHNDFVTSIAFHPRDDRFFLAGSLDKRLRLWSIPEKSVAFWNQLPDMITAVSFTPDGKCAMAGCHNGQCMFYETEGLKFQTQLHARSTRSKKARGTRITAISTVQAHSGEVKVLITSNDSRLRLYNFRDKALEIKLRGCENNTSQIRAALSDDLRYVSSGSEDGRACIWPIHSPDDEDRPETWPLESFQAAHDTVVTCVAFAPTATRQLLDGCEDPIYELCKCLPENGRTGYTPSTRSKAASSIHGDDAPQSHRVTPDRVVSGSGFSDVQHNTMAEHRNGNIIVTADYAGCIKVFRQDCAWTKRRATDQWGDGATASSFGRRGGSGMFRSSGVMHSKTSNRSLRTNTSSDMITSWRREVSSGPNDARSGSVGGRNASIASSQATSQVSLLSDGGQRSASLSQSVTEIRPGKPSPTPSDQHESHEPLTATEANPLMLQGEQSNMFWNVELRRKEAERIRQQALENGAGDLGTTMDRMPSNASRLTLERSSVGTLADGDLETMSEK